MIYLRFMCFALACYHTDDGYLIVVLQISIIIIVCL